MNLETLEETKKFIDIVLASIEQMEVKGQANIFYTYQSFFGANEAKKRIEAMIEVLKSEDK